MDFLGIALLSIVVSVILILLGVPIAFSIGATTVLAIVIGLGPAPLSRFGQIPFTNFHSLNWIPLPLFLLMASLIGQTTIGSDIFDTAQKWLSHLPGGLLVASVVGQGLMAATMGSSGTTILTVGTVVEPEVERLKYNKPFSMAALLAGGVLGPLIPPSTNMIVYGVAAQESVSQLFIAGVLPGILLIVMLSLYIIIVAKRHPEYCPTPIHVTWPERIRSLAKTWPVIVLIAGIMVGIYAGIVTATEAGALGVILTLIIAACRRELHWANLKRALTEAASLTAMVTAMMIAVNCFTYIVSVSGMSQKLVDAVMSLNVSPILIVIIINIIVLLLGCIMDGLAIMLATLPLFIPIINSLGMNSIWFGVLMCVNIEIGLITPPIGLNLFLVSGKFGVKIKELIRAVFPFIIVLVVFLGLLIAFPQISTWLPSVSSSVG